MENFHMYKEYPIEKFRDVLKEIESSDNPSSMLLLMNYLGTSIIQNYLIYSFSLNEDEVIEFTRKTIKESEVNYAKETVGLIGKYCGAFAYCIQDFPEKYVLITKPKGE